VGGIEVIIRSKTMDFSKQAKVDKTLSTKDRIEFLRYCWNFKDFRQRL